MAYTSIKTTVLSPAITLISLSRPDKLNALNASIFEELSHALRLIQKDKLIKGLILTGEGDAFCAGADLKRLLVANEVEGHALSREGQAVFSLLEQLGKPSIAAVNGLALGGGCELAMATTLRIANTKARFGQPEVKLGLIPGYGGTQRLPRLIGLGRALDLCLTGKIIDAQTALAWGLISQISEDSTLMQVAQNYLEIILAMGPEAIQTLMRLIYQSRELSLEKGLEAEALDFGQLCGKANKQEGIQAVLDKRKPNFISG